MQTVIVGGISFFIGVFAGIVIISLMAASRERDDMERRIHEEIRSAGTGEEKRN